MKEKVQQWLHNHPLSIWAAVLFLLAFLQYSNTLGHQYAWDDDIVIVHNSRVKRGFAGIPAHFEFRTRENFEDFSGYRPITMTSFSIDVGLFGLNPKAGHWMNVLLFALAVVVLFRTLRLLFPQYHIAFSFFVALLYLVHPIHVEAVANIKSRDEILAMLFALLSLNFFLRHCQTGNWWQLGLSALMLTLGALSKEGALTYLAVMPLAVIFLMEGDVRRKAIALLKFPIIVLVLVGVFWVLTGHAPGTPSPVASKGYMESQTLGNCMATNDLTQGNWQRIGNSSYLFYRNLTKFLFPVDLVYFSGYNMYPVKDWTLDAWELGWITGLNIFFVLCSAVFWRRIKALVFAYGYYFFTVIVYLQLPGFLLADTIADRFLFLPSIGLCIAVVYVMYGLLWLDPAGNPMLALGKVGKAAATPGRMRWVVLSALVCLTAMAFAGMTWSRNRVWKDNLTLFTHDLPLLENCARAHYYYANVIDQGIPTAKDPEKAKAEVETHLLRAIAITPQSYYAYIRLAQHYQRYQKYAAQRDLMAEAVQIYLQQSEVWHLKGIAEYHLGEYEQAALDLQQARLLDPELEDTWEFLARAYTRAHHFQEALQTLDEALQRYPTNLYLYDALSETYKDMGDFTSACQPLLQLIERDGTNPIWWGKLIGCYQLAGDSVNASRYYQEALRRGIAL